jgi:hypothetical protein
MASKLIRNQYFKQVVSQNNNVSGSSFTGVLSFKYNLSNCLHGTERTYCQVRLSLTRADGTQLQIGDNIAPSYMQPYTLFNNCEVYVNNELVDMNDNLQQCEVLTVRQMSSEPIMQNVLTNTIMSNYDFENRQWDVSSDAPVGARRLEEYELSFSVPNSLFKTKSFIPCGSDGVDFEIRLTVNPSYKMEAVQSKAIGTTNYKIDIKEIYVYAHVVETNINNGDSERVELNRVKVQFEDLKGIGKQLLQVNLEDSANKLTLAFINKSFGSDPYYPSTLFIDPASRNELKVKYIQINYKNLNYPQTVQELKFNSTSDYTTRMYYENLLQNNKMFMQGGDLSLEMFHESGTYYTLPLYNPYNVQSPLCRVDIDFGSTNVDNLRALIFSHHSQQINFSINNNKLVMSRG